MSQTAPKIFTKAATPEIARKLEQALASCRTNLRRKPRDAEAHYRRALALHPHYPEVLNNLGITLRAFRQPRPGDWDSVSGAIQTVLTDQLN